MFPSLVLASGAVIFLVMPVSRVPSDGLQDVLAWRARGVCSRGATRWLSRGRLRPLPL